MNWMLDVIYIVFFMTLTGSLMTLAWYVAGRWLEKAGFLYITYMLMKVVMIFWLCPFVYIILNGWDLFCGRWGGDLFLGSPALHRAGRVLFLLWLAGVVVNLLRYLVALRRISRLHRSLFPCEKYVERRFGDCVRQMGITEHVCVRQSFQVKVPQVSGVIRPVVVLPAREYMDRELDVIFAHELTHVKHRDLLMKNLAMLARAVHFMNPAAWQFVRVYERWSEYACDYEVCRTEDANEYYTVILDMAEEISFTGVMVSRLVENKNILCERIEKIVKCSKKKNRSKALAAFLLAGILIFSGSAVYGASVKTADLIRGVNRATASEIIEPEDSSPMVEIVEPASEADPGITEYTGEVTVNQNERSSMVSFDWRVPANSLVKTFMFKVQKGQTISISALSTSSQTYHMGIINSAGTKRYVTVTRGENYDFEITQDGYYSVFIRNPGSAAINVSGNYTVY